MVDKNNNFLLLFYSSIEMKRFNIFFSKYTNFPWNEYLQQNALSELYTKNKSMPPKLFRCPWIYFGNNGKFLHHGIHKHYLEVDI